MRRGKTPIFIKRPALTVRATGVASASAQGQVTISTAMVLDSQISEPASSQYAAVAAAITSMTATKPLATRCASCA